MSSIRAVCLLYAALFAMVRGFTHEDMKDAMLKKLGLSEVPKIHKRDLENLVIPAHIKNKYSSMLQLHHARKRRSLPSLAGILRGIPGNAGEIYNAISVNANHYSDIKYYIIYMNISKLKKNCAFFPDISGEFIYSDATRQRVVFEMKSRIPDNSEVTMAELKLFKKAPHKRSMPERKGHRPVNNARVSIYWVELLDDGSNRTSLVDSR